MNKSRIIYYLATAIVMLLQLIINEFNYDSIPVENIRKRNDTFKRQRYGFILIKGKKVCQPILQKISVAD